MKVRKYFYRIPLEVSCKVGDKTVSFKRKIISVVAPQKNIAIAIAKKNAIEKCKKRFPSANEIEVKIDIQNIKISGSKLVDTKNKKRKPRPRMLPFKEQKKKFLKVEEDGKRVVQVGDRVIEYPLISINDNYYIYLLPTEKWEEVDNRLVIIGERNEYVKILVYNKIGDPLLIRWELKNKKLQWYPEFIDEVTEISFINNDYKEAKNIAVNILKDKGGKK